MKQRIYFKPGQHTRRVWCGDIVTDCEFIRETSKGALLFFDHTFKCYRRARWTTPPHDRKEIILNGWECSTAPYRK